MPIIRKAVGAGRWFPSRNLKRDVENYINNAQIPQVNDRIIVFF
jgi:hypothetical protein